MFVALIASFCEKFRHRESPGRCDLRGVDNFLPRGVLLGTCPPNIICHFHLGITSLG